MVACFSLAYISSFASYEEAINASAQELKSDSCNVERCCNVNACDSINMPVFIVDGVEVQVQDLDSLPTKDIVSMKVVQDEAIRKIFSPRLGAVILLTTKSKRFLTPVLENYNRGLEIRKQNRIPGRLIIRGNVNENSNDSIGGNNCCSNPCDSINMPVFIVDGVEVQEQYLNGLQEEDIEKVEVIKDNAITKIFSPRLGGVLLITTKSKRFLNPVLENYNRRMKEKERNRIPGQILIRGSVNENSNDSISGNGCYSNLCDSIEHRVFVNPHQNPYYLNGGDDGLLNDLYTTLSRIAPLTQDSIQGKAMFSFAITKDGSVDPNSIKLWRNRSVPEEYINAAIEAIKSLGKFEPGKLNGIPKKVTWNICIKYPIPLDRIKTDIE